MSPSPERTAVLAECAMLIVGLPRDPVALVGIDGPDAVGKTRFGDDLAAALRDRRENVVVASIDGFHNPASVRHRRESDDPGRSFYEDSFDLQAFEHRLLAPARRDPPGTIHTAVFDHRTDEVVSETAILASGGVLLVEGVFLLRPELAGWWDLSIYLSAPERVTMERGVKRDAPSLDGTDAARRRYEARYVPGQALYRSIADPAASADVVIEMSDPQVPVILNRG